jgi:hypothetical protein
VLTVHSFCRLPWPSTISVGARLFTVDSRLSLSLLTPTTDWLSLRNSCLKVGMCGRYSEHLVPPFIYAVYEFGYWGNVRCVFHMGSSGPILGIANRYCGYEIRNQLSVEWQRHRFPGIRLHRQQRRDIRLLDSSDNLCIGSPSQYLKEIVHIELSPL